ncbi:unnamed protein product [Ostreobium quekettii]|uniref:Fatty acid hydroxylase domain-containing protein n=1 Tax=Ostreobium quekettii TaxID=121088 RepID=A0A8S1J3I2_9CHLO|nr:unnamed protein product [Ostreobium quekettii]|eukprot:evm.model.scf_957.4 EVM.evm.TU.scf_957.4   scf_957:31843-37958(+)
MFSAFHDFEFRPGSLQRWIQAAGAPDLRLPDVTRKVLPFMLACTVLEFFVAALLHKKVYYRRQTWSNVAGGAIGFVLSGLFLRGLNVFPYLAVYHFIGLKLIGPATSNNIWVNIFAFLGFDFTHYWAHRAGHVTNIGWAGHSVHHNSPDMNFTTAFRQGITEPFIACWFYLPVALVSPPDVFFWHRSINLVYQFFLHTQVIPKLGPLEWVLNTPSHHRVHHARNYGRVNYAGVLIIWDRMFGTFEEERDDKPCLYGLDERQVPLDTHNPMWQQLFHWVPTIKMFFKTRNPMVLFTRATGEGMLQPHVVDALTSRDGKEYPKVNTTHFKLPKDGIPCDSRPLSLLDVYVAIQSLALAGPATLAIMRMCGGWTPVDTVVAVLHTGGAFTTCGMFLDGTKIGRNYEIARLLLLAATAWYYLAAPYVYWVQIYGAISIAVCCFVHSTSGLHATKAKKA